MRNKIGLTSLREIPIRMNLHLYSNDNDILGHRLVRVPSRARVQINQVLRAFRTDDYRDCRKARSERELATSCGGGGCP